MAARAVSLLALVAVLATLWAPTTALAQSAPGLGAPEPEETAPAPVTTDDPTDDGLETWQQVLIFAAGIVLLGGIAAAIMSDARRSAPGRDRGRERRAGGEATDEAVHRHRQASKQRARRKGRAAREARRRNR
jgi:hypothetical protein